MVTEFDSLAFRHVMGRFATGVAVITAESGDDGAAARVAMTANSLTSVSLRPPLILFCVSRDANGFELWHEAKRYGISILAEDQTDLALRFAEPFADKWGDTAPVHGETGVPLIPGALATLEGTRERLIDGGDHEIHLIRVSALTVLDEARQPLVFFGGAFRGLEPDAPQGSPSARAHQPAET